MIGLGAAFLFPIAGVILASAAIGFGIWGLHSHRRVAALVGIILSCLCLALAVFNTGVEVYEAIYGTKFWGTSLPVAP